MTERRARLPFNPPFFYGWVIVATAAAAACMASTASNVFTGGMVRWFEQDLGWTRTEVTGVVTVGTVLAGAVGSVMGRLADRFGPRVVMPAGAAVYALGMLIVAGMDSLWQFYAGYLLARSVGSPAIGGVVSQTAIVNWFVRMRGRTLGITSMSLPVSQSVLVPIAQVVAAGAGWRMVYLLVAAGVVLVSLLPSLIFMRRRPEDVGLEPDGGAGPAAKAGKRPSRQRGREFSFQAGEAARTVAFWALVAGQFCAIIGSGAVSFHLPLFWGDKGLSLAIGAATLSAFALIGGLSSGVWGVLSERYSERGLAIAIQSGAALVLVLMLVFDTPLLALLLSAGYGLTSRGEGTLFSMLIANYYGRGHYGSIAGLLSPFASVGLGLGPLVASLGFDLAGNYTNVWLLFAALHMVTVVLLLLVRPPALPARALSDPSRSPAP